MDAMIQYNKLVQCVRNERHCNQLVMIPVRNENQMVDIKVYQHPIDKNNPIELFKLVKPRYIPREGDIINHLGEGYIVKYTMHISDNFGVFPILAVQKLE